MIADKPYCLKSVAKVFRSSAACLLIICGQFAAWITEAGAENILKKALFENCDLAEAEAAKLSVQAREEFYAYLQRVIEMQVDSVRKVLSESVAGPSSAHPPAMPWVGSPDLNVWRVFEPTREIEAKECALRILRSAAPHSLVVVPQMFRLTQEKRFSFAFRAAIEGTAWAIIQAAAKNAEYQVRAEIFAEFLEHHDSSSWYLAQNALIELHAQSVPFLAGELRGPDEKLRREIIDILLRIDDQGNEIGRHILPLLDSSEDGLRAKVASLLSRLPAVYGEAFPIVVRHLSDPGPAVKQEFCRTLAVILSSAQAEQLQVSPELLEMLFKHLSSSSAEQRDIVERGILVLAKSPPDALAKLQVLQKSEDSDLRRRALKLIGALGFQGDAVFNSLVEALYDPSLPVRREAIAAMGKQTGRDEQIIAALMRVLRSVYNKNDPVAIEQLILESAVIAQKLRRGPELSRMVPYFIDGLAFRGGTGSIEQSGEPMPAPLMNSAVTALIHIGTDSLPLATKALRSKDALVRRRAIAVMSEIEPLDSRRAEAVIQMLKDPEAEVRAEAIDALPVFGPLMIQPAEEALQWKERKARLGAAEVLVASGRDAPLILNVLREGYRLAPCKEKVELINRFRQVEEFHSDEEQRQVIDCLIGEEGDSSRFIAALIQLAPLLPKAASVLEEAMRGAVLSSAAKFQLAKNFALLGINEHVVVEILVAMLREGDKSVRARAALLLGKMGSKANAAVPALKAVFEDPGQEMLLRQKAAVAVTRIDAAQIDYSSFFLQELSGLHYQWAQHSVSQLDAALAVPLIVRALKESPPERRALIVRILSNFGQDAQSAAADVAMLLREEDPALHFESLVVMLRISPAAPEVEPALRRELTGRFAERLYREKFPPEAGDNLQKIIDQPQSFVQYRAARRMLKKLAEHKNT